MNTVFEAFYQFSNKLGRGGAAGYRAIEIGSPGSPGIGGVFPDLTFVVITRRQTPLERSRRWIWCIPGTEFDKLDAGMHGEYGRVVAELFLEAVGVAVEPSARPLEMPGYGGFYVQPGKQTNEG